MYEYYKTKRENAFNEWQLAVEEGNESSTKQYKNDYDNYKMMCEALADSDQ